MDMADMTPITIFDCDLFTLTMEKEIN